MLTGQRGRCAASVATSGQRNGALVAVNAGIPVAALKQRFGSLRARQSVFTEVLLKFRDSPITTCGFRSIDKRRA
jgi:hypothetical protein